MSNPALDYAATLTNEISPVVDAIIASLEQMGSTAEAVSAQMTAAFDAVETSAAQSADTVAGANAAMAESAGATTASTDALAANKQALDETNDSTRGLGAQFAALRMPLIVAGVALAGIGIGAAVVGTQYESSMSVVQALTGQTSAQMAQFNDQILADAPAWGVGPKALGDSLYYILSAGTPANQAMGELEVVAKASAASFVDAKDDANALTTALNSYGKGAQDAWQYQDLLLTAVKDGKQQMSDLASSIGKAASMGSIAGVSFAQVAAAESTLTLTGVSARLASLDLYDLMKVLDLQTDTLAKRAKSLGVSFDEQKFKTMDLYHQLQYLEEATGGDASKLQALINNAPAFQAATKLMTDNGADFAKILDDMGHSSGMTATAFAIHEQTMGAAFERLRASAEVALIHISQALEPIITSIVAHVIPALNQFSGWAATHGPQLFAIISTIATAFGVALVGAVGAATVAFVTANAAAIGITAGLGALTVGIALVITHWKDIEGFFTSSAPLALVLKGALVTLGGALLAFAVSQIPVAITAIGAYAASWIPAIALTLAGLGAIALAAAPFIAIGAAIAAVIGIIILLVTHWQQVTTFLGTTWRAIESLAKTIWTDIASFFTGLWNGLTSFFITTWNSIKQAIQTVWNTIATFLTSLMNGIKQGIQATWNAIMAFFLNTFTGITNIVQMFVTAIVGFFKWLYDHNYYFADLVNGIIAEFTFVQNVATAIWNAITGFFVQIWETIKHDAIVAWNLITGVLSAVWEGIKTAAVVVWNAITTLLGDEWRGIQVTAQAAWNLVKSFIITPIQDAWSTITRIAGLIVGALQSAWNTVTSDVRNAWNTFTNIISTAVGAVGSAIGAILNAIKNPLTGLANDALGWGKAIIQSFIDGIKNMAGAVGDAASGIANSVKSFLGFHSPAEEGPGADADTWAPNLMHMYVNGIAQALPAVHTVATQVADTLQESLTAPLSSPGTPVLSGSGAGGMLVGSTGTAASVGLSITIVLDRSLALLDPQYRTQIAQGLAGDIVEYISRQRELQTNALYSYPGR
jgi:TP901 family phage tail tape measure protein